MKTFSAVMALATAVTLASAQVQYNPDTGVWTCPVPNGAYCAGNSLETNIIIRCINGTGHPGNCNDNLAGSPPLGVNFSPCWEPSKTSGQAACSKNCVVYGGSGNYNGTFTLPDCVPSYISSSSSSSVIIPTPTGGYVPYPPIATGTGGPVYPTNGTNPIYSSTSAPGGLTTSATATPKSPTATTSSSSGHFTGAASANDAGLALAALGLFAAYVL